MKSGTNATANAAATATAGEQVLLVCSCYVLLC
jgi:hypothetical protein